MVDSGITLFVSIILIFISLIFIIRWWGMTSDIKAIRNYLYKKESLSKENKDTVYYSANKLGLVDSEEIITNKDVIDKLILKMKPNQCIIKVLANSRLEIWDKSDWEESVSCGKANYFQLLYENY